MNLPEESPKPTRKNNIHAHERKALENLKKNETIIKQADKGGVIVIMDKLYYKTKILEILSYTKTYMQLKEDKDGLSNEKDKETNQIIRT